MYRIGLPFWKLTARLGVPMHLRVHVQRDQETQLFVATSLDLRALVVEASSMDELVAATQDAIDMLMDEYFLGNSHVEAELRIKGLVGGFV